MKTLVLLFLLTIALAIWGLLWKLTKLLLDLYKQKSSKLSK
jgi:hypothetical protein